MPYQFGAAWTPVYQDTMLAKPPLGSPVGTGTLSAPKRTLGSLIRDKITNAVAPVAGKRMATKLADLVDYTPVAAATEADAAGQSARGGDYLAAAGHTLGSLLSVVPDGGALGAKGLGALHAIIAPLWHGSPHKFERFALDKIGTGEGAQAYGHGLYFAENKGVADQYRATLSGFDNPNAVGYISKAGGDKEAAIRAMEADLAGRAPSNHIAELRQQIANAGNPRGHLYEVKLNANPEDFLNWDGRLGEQPQGVRDALTAAYADAGLNLPKSGVLGMANYSDVGALHGKTKADASNYLLSKGIPGIRYLDQGSRAAGAGTHNYVVFDPSIIDVLNRH